MRVILADTAHDFIMLDRTTGVTVLTIRRGMCLSRAVDLLRPELTERERRRLMDAATEEVIEHEDVNDILVQRVNARLRHSSVGSVAQSVALLSAIWLSGL